MKAKKNKVEKNYFIKDEVLKAIEEDEFGHKNFALVLKDIIEKQKTPLNIGIFGNWGVGKSSIVALYKKLIEDELVKKEKDTIDTTKIAFIEVPVWKYARKESLRNKFIFKIAKGLYADIDKLNEQVYGTRTLVSPLLLKPEYLFNELKKFKENISWGFLGINVVIAVVIIYFLSKYFKIISTTDVLSMIQTFFISIIPSIVLFFIKAIQSAKVQISYPRFDCDEQFESKFIKIVEDKKCKKFIFIDDLDRCSVDNVVGTLETIKTFLDIPSCVFVIACDNKVIEKAIDESNEIYKKSEENNGAQYLEKFFQYAITVPPFIKQDMREYAKNILKKHKSKLLELRDIDDILFVLIHGGVVNPRRAIVLINSFVADYLVVKEREKDPESRLNLDTITSHLPALAKLSVLKHDFPEFYSDLVKNKDLIKWMTAYVDGENESLVEYQQNKCLPYLSAQTIGNEGKNRMPDCHKQWDESVYLESDAGKKYELYCFLSATREYDRDIKDLRPFLFLGQDSASYGMADEYLENIVIALKTGQVLSIKDMLEKGNEEDQVKTSNIILDWIEHELAGPELRNAIYVISECLPFIPEKVVKRAAHILIDKALRVSIKERIKSLNIDGMFLAANLVKSRSSNIIKLYIDNLSHQDLDFEEKILDCIFRNENLIRKKEQIMKIKTYLDERPTIEEDETKKPVGFLDVEYIKKKILQFEDSPLVLKKFFSGKIVNEITDLLIDQDNIEDPEKEPSPEYEEIEKCFTIVKSVVLEKDLLRLFPILTDLLKGNFTWEIALTDIEKFKDQVPEENVNLLLVNLLVEVSSFALDNKVRILELVDYISSRHRIEKLEVFDPLESILESFFVAEKEKKRSFDFAKDFLLKFGKKRIRQEIKIKIWDNLIEKIDPVIEVDRSGWITELCIKNPNELEPQNKDTLLLLITSQIYNAEVMNCETTLDFWDASWPKLMNLYEEPQLDQLIKRVDDETNILRLGETRVSVATKTKIAKMITLAFQKISLDSQKVYLDVLNQYLQDATKANYQFAVNSVNAIKDSLKQVNFIKPILPNLSEKLDFDLDDEEKMNNISIQILFKKFLDKEQLRKVINNIIKLFPRQDQFCYAFIYNNWNSLSSWEKIRSIKAMLKSEIRRDTNKKSDIAVKISDDFKNLDNTAKKEKQLDRYVTKLSKNLDECDFFALVIHKIAKHFSDILKSTIRSNYIDLIKKEKDLSINKNRLVIICAFKAKDFERDDDVFSLFSNLLSADKGKIELGVDYLIPYYENIPPHRNKSALKILLENAIRKVDKNYRRKIREISVKLDLRIKKSILDFFRFSK